jgi:hypothetical protein
MKPPSTHTKAEPVLLVVKVARAFASLVENHVGLLTMQIDAFNRFSSAEVCHSHDYCDANVFMRQAILDVTGVDAAAELPHLSAPTYELWQDAWNYTKRMGFHRLSTVRGQPDFPPEILRTEHAPTTHTTTITLPTAPPLEDGAYPLDIELDYYGRAPHLQVLCRNHGSTEGAPAVCVRYDRHGQVVEILIGSPDILIVGDFDKVKVHRGTGDTPWEIERDANPICQAGDRLKMPSGQVAEVLRLRDRYDNDIEQFRAYDATYGILARMDGYPNSDPRHQVYTSIEQAWEVNPLTASTANPDDFSTVFESATTSHNDKTSET